MDDGSSKLRPDGIAFFANDGSRVGAPKAPGSATDEAPLRRHRVCLPGGALRGGALGAGSGPLSETVNSGEILRGSYTPFVASLVDAANKMAAELEDAEDRLAARGTDESKTPPDRS